MNNSHFFVQFLHPGSEARATSTVADIKWNRGSHQRKFMRQAGTCMDKSGNTIATTLTFWGEWEAECRIIDRRPQASNDFPTLLFEPFYRTPKSYQGLTNTDPFVFGDKFHYAICQQFKGVNPNQLNNLQQGDVILFGSCKGQKFILDSVLVISDSILFKPSDYTACLNGKVSRVHEDVVLKTLLPPDLSTISQETYVPSTGACVLVDRKCASEKMLRLYFGATVDNQVNGMFSFSPCKPFEKDKWGFARPIIEIPGIISPSQRQGHKLNQHFEQSETVNMWNKVKQQVFEAGLSLGTSFSLPELVH